MTAVRTLLDGDTVDARVVLTAIDTAVPTADPTSADRGANAQGADFLHVYVELPGSMTELRISPWYFSNLAEQWFESDQLVFSTVAKFGIIETRGEERVFFVADAVTGTGIFKLWAGYSFENKDF